MNIKLKTADGVRIMPSTQIKSICAVSQCNLLVTKTNGEQMTAVEIEF